MSIIYIDTEYSGFFSMESRKSGELVQVSCIAVDDMENEHVFNERCRPLTKKWSSDAEKVHKISRDRAMMAQHPEELAIKLIAWLATIGDTYSTLKGWNCKGDKQYIERLMTEYKLIDKWYLRTRPQWKDVLDKAKKRKNYMPTANMKLETIAKYFGVPHDAHDALSDAIATKMVDSCLSTIDLPKKHIQEKLDIELGAKEKTEKYMSRKYVQIGTRGDVYLTEIAMESREAIDVIFSELYSMYVTDLD